MNKIKVISNYIRNVRSSKKCEWCGIQNGIVGYRDLAGNFITLDKIKSAKKEGYDYFKNELYFLLNNKDQLKKDPTKISLSLVYLDGDKNNISYAREPENIFNPELNNLFCLCQRCSFRHELKLKSETKKSFANQLEISF